MTGGTGRVIVELRIDPPFRPEGDLPDKIAISTQRKAIATAQRQLLARLRGTAFAVIHQYDALPLLALQIGPDALAILETSGDLVARVTEDATRTPSSPRSRSQ